MPKFTGMSQATADQYRAGAADAYGNPAERQISDGSAPCRCCLRLIPGGKAMLLFAYRPFASLHAYAETGPVFVCADHCASTGTAFPKMIVSPDYLLKAHAVDERVIYGTGQITSLQDIEAYATNLLKRDGVAFVDLRSAKNNCWLARVTPD